MARSPPEPLRGTVAFATVTQVVDKPVCLVVTRRELMKIGVFGTGTVGRTLAARLTELGHSVTIGTRDPAATTARTEPDGMGNPPFASWHAEHPDVTLG